MLDLKLQAEDKILSTALVSAFGIGITSAPGINRLSLRLQDWLESDTCDVILLCFLVSKALQALNHR